MKIEIIKGTETPVTKFFSNTPETDAAWACFKGYTEPLQDVKDLSRKLERERDEAREDLKFRRGFYRVQVQYLEAAKRERDEARHKLELCMAANSDVARIAKERDEARKDTIQLADRLSGLELRTTEELAKMEQERNASRELAIAFHNDQTNLILLLQEWKDMAAKLVNIASYALGEFDVKLTLDQQRNITETMQQYHSLLKKQ
jgi:hypothetical protein